MKDGSLEWVRDKSRGQSCNLDVADRYRKACVKKGVHCGEFDHEEMGEEQFNNLKLCHETVFFACSCQA